MQNKLIIKVSSLILISIFLAAFSSTNPWNNGKKHIEASSQRSGDPVKGRTYLFNGDYVSSGIPYKMFERFMSADTSNLLKRGGKASILPPQFNYVKTDDGVELATPNCLTCHSDYINGEFVVGLGNTTFDYTLNTSALNTMLGMMIKNNYGDTSSVWKAYEPFSLASQALGGNIKTKVRGINPADQLTAVLVAHRSPMDLTWHKKAQLEIPEVTVPTDVPPWWHLKKKNAMFYTAIGRGDFSRFLMASSLLTLQDSTEAAEIDKYFPDVLSWIETLEAPKYPFDINKDLVKDGERLFELNCSGCHGTYGESGEYPNYLVALDKVKTDPTLSNAYAEGNYDDFINWYEKSWFSTGPTPGKVVVESGYVAPPLDGVWATAPYLHNGSVPTVEALLNSKIRPEFWERSFESTDYDTTALGWNYKTDTIKSNNLVYDTSLPGYGNQGHYFGDDLDQDERMAIIEYLKTL